VKNVANEKFFSLSEIWVMIVYIHLSSEVE
jgi:hypothetical protein